MFCQTCGLQNSEEQEHCRRCHQKLLVLSGSVMPEDQEAFVANPAEQLSFDEHLLERISILEEVARRTADSLRQVLGTLYRLEEKTLVNQTAITSLRDLLDVKRVLPREEWNEVWESRMDTQLLALEKRERFGAIKEEIRSLYRGDQADRFESYLEEAELALLSFDMNEALRHLEAAHGLDQANHELSFFLGETYFNEGQGEKALAYFLRVLEVKPSHYESLVLAGVLRYEQGDASGSEENLKRAVALYPGAFLPAFSLGAVCADQGDLRRAVAFLERAVEIEPMAQAHLLLGSCCYEMGRLTAAIKSLETTVRLDPSLEEAHYLLGLAYLDRRWFRKAQTAFREAELLAPRRLAYHELAHLVSAAQEAEAPELAQGTAACLTQAEEALQAGQAKAALALFRQALAEAADHPTVLSSYAMACLEMNRVQEVEPLVNRLLETQPNERFKATAYATLIEALRSQGKLREGNRVGRRLLAESESDFARSVAYFEMAFNQAEMEENLDEALDLARRSLDLSPPESRRLPLAALGWVHYKRREFQQAVDCLTRSSELGSSAQILAHLGMALLASGERERARSILRQARRLEEETRPGKVLAHLRDNAWLWQETEASPGS